MWQIQSRTSRQTLWGKMHTQCCINEISAFYVWDTDNHHGVMNHLSKSFTKNIPLKILSLWLPRSQIHPFCTRVIFVPAQDVGLSSAFSNKRWFEEKKGMKPSWWSTSITDLAVQQCFYYQHSVLIGKLKPLSDNLHLFTKTQRSSLIASGTSILFLLIWRQTQVTAFGFFSYYWLWEKTLFVNTTHNFNILVNSCKIF